MPISPTVEATPTRATAQKSATISEIHRLHSRHAGAPSPASEITSRSSACSEDTSPSSAAPWWPTSWTSDEAMLAPTIRSRGMRTIATGFSPPPGSRVRARRIAAPGPRAR